MCHATALLWIFFRAATLGAALSFLEAIVFGNYVVPWPLFRIGVIVLCVALHLLERRARRHAADWRERLARAWWGPAAEGFAFGTLATLCVLVSGCGQDFIYFQF
jgi:hypothetical protein